MNGMRREAQDIDALKAEFSIVQREGLTILNLIRLVSSQ